MGIRGIPITHGADEKLSFIEVPLRPVIVPFICILNIGG
jgi:hypothetical protein